MPIRPPALDDRCYDDLVKELIARIPAHTPEWTNPRTGDPGRTLIDLFAWLGDALLYRVNLIPERQRLVFLRLLGQPLRPANPARGLVTVSLKPEKTDVYLIKSGAHFTGAAAFECSDEFTVLPVNTAVFYKRNPLPGEVDQSVIQALSVVQNHGAPVQPYITTQLFQNIQQTKSFDIFGDSQDRSLWFALLAPKKDSSEEQKTSNESVIKMLGGDDQGQRLLLNIGFVPGLPTLPDDDENDNTSDATSMVSKFNIVPSLNSGDLPETGSVHARVPHIWDVAIETDKETINTSNPWNPRYLVLDEVADSTQGLTRPGIIRLALPRGQVLYAPPNDLREDFNAGVGDRPPRIDDKTIVSQLIGWIRLRPRPPYKSENIEQKFTPDSGTRFDIPQISSGADTSEVEHLWATWFGVNAVAVEQLVTSKNLIIGESNGTADQQFSLPAGSVESETLQIFVEEDSGWIQWNRVDDLYTLDRDPIMARDARVFQLDPEAGTIRFGDGVRGRVAGAGRRILVGQMRSTSGSAGNLPAGSIRTVLAETLKNENVGSNLSVDQPMPFTGGTDAETLSEAEKRIPALLRHRDRAVTIEDYRTIAFETPGAAVARVEILPRFKPQQRFFNVPGIVSVMVLPQAQRGPAPNPRADRPFLEKVHAWLDARRPVGTELYVIGCEYVPVVISVAVSIADGAAIDTTLQAVKDALMKALWPLQGGGFDGNGWKVKKTISNRELAAEVARVRGISEVNDLNLFRRNQKNDKRTWCVVGDAGNGKEQNIDINEWQFPELLGVVVVIGDDAPLDIDSYLGMGDYSGTETNPPLVKGVAVPVASSLHCTCGRQL